MKKNTASSSKLEEDASDAISTATNNSGHHSNAEHEHSPSGHHNLTGEEADSLCDGSKKIRKKRNTYQKIDDDVRLKLLDAVKHGETLKSAAKKYKINYSSAKSILHTYRKEGRILKKSAQERNIKRNPAGGDDGDESPGTADHLEGNEEFHVPARVQHGTEHQKMEVEPKEDAKQKSATTAAGLVDNLVNLLKLSVGNVKPEDSSDRILQPQALKTPLKVVPKVNKTEEGKTDQKSSVNKIQNLLLNENAENSMNLANLSQLLHGNPLDNIKALEGFYTSFSNSLLGSTDKSTSGTDISNSAQPEKAAKEPEPLAEVTNEAKSQPKQGEEICVPHPLRFNTAQLLQEKVESKLSNDEDADWDNTIENAAMDTFKSFMDAQLLLCDALKKASYLKNLMQTQKSRGQAAGLANNQL